MRSRPTSRDVVATKASIRTHSFLDCSPTARPLPNALRSLIGSDRLACRGTVNALGSVDKRDSRMETDDSAKSGFIFSINHDALTIFSFRKGGAVSVSDVQRQSTLTTMLGRIFMAGQDLPGISRVRNFQSCSAKDKHSPNGWESCSGLIGLVRHLPRCPH